MTRGLAGLVLLTALAACAPSYPTKISTTTRTPQGAPPAAGPSTPGPQAPALARRSPIPRPDVTVRDQCGAAEMQGLIGRPRTEIPVPIDPNRQRVACTSCPLSQDYNPARLNFFFDAETGAIKEVRCG